MELIRLKTVDFRNTNAEIEFQAGLNILIGENGQGKTNLLEAIHILSTTRSFRTVKLQEAIRFDAEMAILSCSVKLSEEITRGLRCVLQGSTKQFFVNEKKESVAGYVGNLHSVIFSADQLEVVRGGPEARRQFLDDAIVAIHPPYAATVRDHARVLKQKNALLTDAREREISIEQTAEMLQPWNDQIVSLSTKIHRSRMRIVERLKQALERRLLGPEEISIRYVSSLEGKGDLSEYDSVLAERLKTRVHAELVAGYSLVGPHRDDLEITFDGRDLRRFGSAGQQRSAYLLLLLANVGVYQATIGEYPLVLLDEIDSELDYKRIGRLQEYLSGKTQTVVTTSKQSMVSEFGRSARIFEIANGVAKAL